MDRLEEIKAQYKAMTHCPADMKRPCDIIDNIPYLLSEVDRLKDVEQKRDAYWGRVVHSVQEFVMKKEGEISRLTAQVEALERAQFTSCYTCIGHNYEREDERSPCKSCRDIGTHPHRRHSNWQFDYERFAESEATISKQEPRP